MDAGSILNNFIEVAKFFLDSKFFFVVKFFIAIYVTVLFVDLVLLLIARGVGGNIRVAMKGTDMPTASKKKMQKRWADIEARIVSGEDTQYKLAVLEADGFVNEILSGIGYKGKNMKERLEGINENQLSGIQLLKNAHDIRNEIINNRNFFIDKEQSQKTLGVYKKFLENFEII